MATLERALAAREPYGPALVCVTGASNVTGELWPVRELAAAAHAHGARIVLDAAQLAPHHPVDIAELDVDWVAFSGHKLYAPFGSGVLAGRADWLCAAEPYLAGGGASRRVARRADGGVDVDWHTTAARHEAGSPNVIGAYAIASACRVLTEAGFDRLVEREQALVARVRAGLTEVPEVKVLSLFGDDAPGSASSPSSSRAGTAPTSRRRSPPSTGSASATASSARTPWCAPCSAAPTRSRVSAVPPTPPRRARRAFGRGAPTLNAIRVSFGAGTPDEHVERFVAAVRELVADGAKWRYRTEDGRCVPDRDQA